MAVRIKSFVERHRPHSLGLTSRYFLCVPPHPPHASHSANEHPSPIRHVFRLTSSVPHVLVLCENKGAFDFLPDKKLLHLRGLKLFSLAIRPMLMATES